MKKLAKVVLGAASILAAAPAAKAAWPEDKPIEIIVGFAAGGGTDVMARKLAAAMEKQFAGKARFVVMNRPGASGEIANAAIMRAAPDGYTIGVVNVPGYVFLPLTKQTQYKLDGIRLLARVVDDPTVAVVRSDSKFSDLGAMVAELRAEPGKYTFGHNGVGTNGHLALRMMAEVAKVKATEVPYRGTSDQKTNLLGGHLQVGLISLGEVAELHGGNKGELKVIALLSKAASSVLPSVPTAESAGVPVFMSSERGFAAPKGIPDDIANKLEAAIAASVRDPEFINTSPGDAPVLAFLPGAQWQAHLDGVAKALQPIADAMVKESK
jgi:tripartite-type tricarboxylate transporter receptor subunit TctC